MYMLDYDELGYLLEAPTPPCVSLYMPTHRIAGQTKEDRIRLKNLLQQAEQKLQALGLKSSDIGDILGPGNQLLEDSLYWKYLSDGMAVFLAKKMIRHFQLPLPFEEQVVVGNRFHIKPVLEFLAEDGQFFILAVSQQSIQLFQGSKYSLTEVKLPNLPNSMAEALKHDDPEKQLQFHTRAPVGSADRRLAMFHGQGPGGEDEKDQLLRYFRQIDHALRDILKGQRAPLILAGVEYYLPILRQASHYSNIVDQVISGNPEDTQPNQLHERALEILGPYFQTERDRAIARYQALSSKGMTAVTVEQVLPAASEGRIEALLVAGREQVWGCYDESAQLVQRVQGLLHEEYEDLLNLAAAKTLSKNGRVFPVPANQLPNGSKVAAILRY